MIFWLVLVLVTVAVLALIAWPLFVGPRQARDRTAYDMAVYKDQLAEVDQDLERGLLTPEEAEAARVEVKRRMLGAAEKKGEAVAEGGGGRLVVGALVAVVVSAGSLSMYAYLGSPGQPDRPYAAREAERQQAAQGQQMGDMLKAMEVLAQRLEENPDNPEGWRMLARSNAAIGRYGEAVRAYRRLIDIEGGADAEIWSSFGEALVLAENGVVSPEAQIAFDKALAADRGEPRARYYKAEALVQAGKAEEAVRQWRGLLADSPPDAPWLPAVRQRIQQVSEQFNLPDIADDRPSPERVEELDRETGGLIRSMVESLAQRLEENPDDIQGWMRLGRSYLVLGRHEEARQAYSKAVDLAPRDVMARLGYAEALVADVPQGSPLPQAFVAQMREVEALDPGNQRALYFLGLAAAQSGDSASARENWQRLLEQLPEGSPERADLQAEIDRLGGGG